MSTTSQVASASSVSDMLREDHMKVKGLFEEFEQADDADAKQRIVETALAELEVHAKLEEELIYPEIRQEIDDDLMDEALEERHVVYGLIGELKKMKSSDERYDAKFTVLAENVRHHIKEEESRSGPGMGPSLPDVFDRTTCNRRERLGLVGNNKYGFTIWASFLALKKWPPCRLSIAQTR